jgi:hypothetical protein
MKYLKTINLWESSMSDAILSGQLKLQCGQWVQCGQGKRSRFVRTNGKTIHVAHWQGTGKATQHRFNTLRGVL